MNKVYIILVNFNNFKDTIECIESLLKSDYLSFQIFVVDNSPNSLSIEQFSNWLLNNDFAGVETRFPKLVFPLANKPVGHEIIPEFEFNSGETLFEDKIVIIKAENNGFAAANNIVLKYLLKYAPNSSLIWILNNDTVIEKDTLSNLVTYYEKNINQKLVFGSKLRYYDKPDTIQAVAGFYNKWLGKHYHIGEGEKDKGQYDSYNFGPLNYVVGASIFLPAIFLEEAGLMCEDYFLYFEELDWIKSGLKRGFKMALVPNAIVYHKEGSAIINTGNNHKDTSLAEYYSISNRVKFIKKWYPMCLITVLPGVFWALIKRTLAGRLKFVGKTLTAIFFILFANKRSNLRYERN